MKHARRRRTRLPRGPGAGSITHRRRLVPERSVVMVASAVVNVPVLSPRDAQGSWERATHTARATFRPGNGVAYTDCGRGRRHQPRGGQCDGHRAVVSIARSSRSDPASCSCVILTARVSHTPCAGPIDDVFEDDRMTTACLDRLTHKGRILAFVGDSY